MRPATIRILASALFGAAAIAASAGTAAQEPAPAPASTPTAPADAAAPRPDDRLGALLGELALVPAAAWQARLDAIRADIAARTERAAKLRADAARLVEAAAAEEARVRALAAELDKLGELRKLLDGMQLKPGAAPAGEPQPGAMAGDGAAKPPAEAAPPAPAGAPTTPQPAAAPPKPAPMPTPDAAKPPAATPAPPGPASAPTPAPAADGTAAPAAAPTTPEAELLTWDDHLADVFEQHCTVCHDPGDASGGLDLSSHAAALQGGGSGTTLVPGDPAASRLWLLVSHQQKPTMPPDEPRLPQPTLDRIRTWIEQGAPKDLARARELAAARAKQRAAQAARAAAAGAAGATAAILPAFRSAVVRASVERGPALRAIATSPVAPLMALPGPGQVLLLHSDDTRELGVLAFPFGRAQVLGFSADGARLLAAGGEPGKRGGAVVYDVASGAELGRFGEQRDAVLAAAIAPDGATVAVGGTRRRAQVFAVDDGAELFAIAHDDWVTALAFAAGADRLAAADRAGVIRVVEASTGRAVHELRGHAGEVSALAWRVDGELLASAGTDRSVRLWRDGDGRELWNKRDHGGEVLALAWRGADRLLSAGADRRLLLWKPDGVRDGDLPALPDWVYGVAVTADAARALTADWAGGLGVVDLATRQLVGRSEPFVVTP